MITHSSGKLIYGPQRKKMDATWWCVLDVDKELTRYYRWIAKHEFGVELCKPSWDAHISVVRGEKPKDEYLHLWKEHIDREFEFEIVPKLRQSGDTTRWDRASHFWFINIKCQELLDIRHSLNLPTQYNLHLTVGRTYDN